MELIFAKDIIRPTKTTGRKGKTPEEIEIGILDKCKENGWNYKGFILPIKERIWNTKIAIEVDGKTKPVSLMGFFNGSFRGRESYKLPPKTFERTPEEHLEVAREYYKPLGWDVLGLAEPYQGVDTRLILRCHCHGKIYKKADLHNTKRNGSLRCPIIRGVLRSMMNGEKQVTKSKGTNIPMHFYLFRVGEKFFKFGVTSKPNPIMRMRDIQRTTNEKLIFEYSHRFEKGWQSCDVETGIKKHIKGKRISRKLLPDGWTETLPIDKLDDVKKFIDEYIVTNPSKPIHFYNIWDDLNINDYISDEDIERDLTMFANAPLADLEPEDLELDLSPLETL
ncbi:hypothetical protein [Escherichia coli]|uniref:hypothetical protein n=1 Tax=Escherichia coli TaxID=562 RepID=UPI0022FD4DA6|nr:hypothetical protein [Escherichia coli]MDC9689322.1 hypothetical protein [Escherichia coli]WCA26573.1 hypothetical protein PHA55_09620 [Escherichia coli]